MIVTSLAANAGRIDYLIFLVHGKLECIHSYCIPSKPLCYLSYRPIVHHQLALSDLASHDELLEITLSLFTEPVIAL